MSAAVAWGHAPAPARMPSRASSPQLRLVGPAERVSAPARRATRITRRGRLLITVTVAASLMGLGVGVATSVGASPPEIDHATTVFAGQTLSEVAAAQLPGLPIADAVAEIQLANGLNTSQVRAGQSLLIPSIP